MQHLSTLLLQPHWLFQLLELLISTCRGVEGVVGRETSRERDGDGQIVGKHHQHTPFLQLTRHPHDLNPGLRSPLSKYEAPRASFTETEPRRLGFPLSTSTHSTLVRDHSRAPTASTWAYPIQVRFPLPKYEDPCASFTETEPRRLGFPFHLNSLPLVRVPFLCPHCLNLGLPHPSYIPTIQIQGYPHVVHRNQAPVAQFLHFYLNSGPPSRVTHSRAPTAST